MYLYQDVSVNAILCPAGCISDVTNKAGMCGRKWQMCHEPTFPALHWQRANQHGRALRCSDLEPKIYFLSAGMKVELPNEAWRWQPFYI